ncbi:MAG: T9SS type A sorting domain-containing protein [Schleiferiaceae bacterium]|nr:T9SS type A sorting domain-containing protein [Schleiferiaceae bacterium]
MKKLLLSFAAIAFSVTASAQYYHTAPVSGSNPNNVNQENSEYPVGSGLPTDWTSILGAAQSAGTYSSVQTLPFTFKLQGTAIDSFRVSNTGVLTFSRKTSPADHSVGSAVAITNSTIPDSSICVLGINGSGANDQIARKTFGTSPNRQEWIMFSSYSVTGAAGGWSYWSIVMEETTNNIYIVDQRTATAVPSLTLGVRVNSTNVYDQITSVGSNSTNAPDFLDNTYYTFIQGVQPDYELAAASLNVSPYLGLNAAPFTIAADFTNNGAQGLTSATFNYSVNGSTPMTSSLTGISIASGSTGTLTSSTTWTPSSTGLYTVKAWLSGLNGSNVDANTANDTVSLDIQVVTALTARYPLYETFTSSTCGPCTPANTTMEAVFDDNPGEHNSVKYQMSWPGTGDPYYTAEGGARRTFYGINSVPRVEIDGGWDGNGNGVTQALYDQYQNVPAFVDMTATWSRWTKTIETEVTIAPLADVTSNNLRLFAVIYSHLDVANVKTNGETEFINVVKKMMPNENGETLSALTSGQSVTKTLSYTFNGNYTLPANAQSPANLSVEHTVEDFTNLGVILWVQDISTKEVLQSVDATYTIGQFEETLASELNVYPNPTSGNFFVEGDFEAAATLKLMDMTGRILLQKEADFTGGQKVEISTEGFASGTYLLITTTEGASHAQPVIVK